LQTKVVIDATNYFPQRDGSIPELASKVQHHALRDAGQPGTAARASQPATRMFIAGDHVDAKRVVAGLIESIGFAAVDTGSPRVGRTRQQPGSPIYARPMTIPDAETATTLLAARRAAVSPTAAN
jgi:predicted dinucleotide-binding enzyme